MRGVDLERDYGLTISSLEPHPGGFATEGWVADRKWFVKRWRDGERPVGLELLEELRALGLPVVEPLRTLDGELSATMGSQAYAVFPYVEGRTATFGDWRVAARAMRQVHEAPLRVDLPPANTDEPAIEELGRSLDHPWIADRADEVSAAIARLESVRTRVAEKPVRAVVCHTTSTG